MTEPVWTGTTTAMGGRSSLPTPGERSDSDFSGPPSLLWYPWLELGASNQILVFNSVLTQNYQSVLSAQMAVIRIKLLQQSLTTLPYCFPSFLNEIPKSHSPEWILPGIKNEQPELSSLSTFKDFLGLSWVNCHLMSHLLTFHFLGESWPQI